MMGVGKTTLGKQLARQLQYTFIDLDKEIEKHAGISIAQIFELHGEIYFRELEQKLLLETKHQYNIVVSTGGGAACFYNNMQWMNEHGKTIYLKANAAFIISRVSPNIAKRPLLQGKSPAELDSFIANLIAQRQSFYEQAHSTIEMPAKSLLSAVK
jgi:shikimate kinase